MTDLAYDSAREIGASDRNSECLSVGLVGPLPPPAGGMATQLEQLYLLLRESKVSVTLVQTNAPYRPQWISRLRGIRALFRLMPYLLALRRMCARADVIHLMANSGWAWHLFAAPVVWIARYHRVPLIINYRGGDAERFLLRAPRWVRMTMRMAHVCIVPSRFLQEILGRFGVKSTIIPNGIDLALFRPRHEHRGRRDAVHIVVTRNLEAIYGIDDALHAFSIVAARYPASRITIAGEGPERPRLIAMVAELDLSDRVRFAGRLTRKEIADLYSDADIMVNPSTIDNMPNSILEAYASGVAVVSTNVGGVSFIARDGETALLVTPRDSSAMADGIIRLIEDTALRDKLVTTSRHEAVQYGWDRIGAEWLALYKRLHTVSAKGLGAR